MNWICAYMECVYFGRSQCGGGGGGGGGERETAIGTTGVKFLDALTLSLQWNSTASTAHHTTGTYWKRTPNSHWRLPKTSLGRLICGKQVDKLVSANAAGGLPRAYRGGPDSQTGGCEGAQSAGHLGGGQGIYTITITRYMSLCRPPTAHRPPPPLNHSLPGAPGRWLGSRRRG